MPKAKRELPITRILETVYAIVAIAWFAVPPVLGLDTVISPFLLPSMAKTLVPGNAPAMVIAYTAFWTIPVHALFKLLFPFLGKVLPAWVDANRPRSNVLTVAWSAQSVSAIAAHAVFLARSPDYFSTISPVNWAVLALSVAVNAWALLRLISLVSAKDEQYREYMEFKTAETGRGRITGIFARRGIQRRLTASFVGIIFAIIVVMSGVLLSDFSRTLLGAVTDNGKGIAERTASVISANFGDSIATDDYLEIEARKNAAQSFPFKSITYWQRDPRTGTSKVAASTLTDTAGMKPKDAAETPSGTVVRESRDKGLISFETPVTLGGKTLGFVSVEYAENVIYEPFFRTQVKAVGIASLFVYLSFFLTYLFGRTIVSPILFLSMSVNTISKSLSGMIKGSIGFSSGLLEYRDRVETNDEIKTLSTEIGNMATVIRGVIPYISASTLKYSERGTPTTERKDLCFMFTDIRGFTTLCEGATPDEVVQMLNHFLELQTTAIMDSGGEIDKFVGDEIMAMFEGKDKELNACRASMRIRKLMAEEREKALKASKKAIEIGIGINSGPVVFGSVGAKKRMDFTSIGDTVNLAARLEGANKSYGTKSLIAEAVYEKVKDEFLCREVDLLTVKGKTKPVRIYEIMQIAATASPKLVKMKSVFEAGLTAYRGRKWAEARKYFNALTKGVNDDTATMFLKRIELFAKNPPPEDWDGVFALGVK